MNSKPLIFVYPLSDTMKKLKEAIEEISESEGVEIYEVDDLQEVAQLVPTIGQSLSIYGAPKKCAMSLKQLRRVNSKLNSKVLLISDKTIPRKTLDKFSKIGLTEFIQEPAPAKTLLYKVKLQLKSIVNDEIIDEEESDAEVKDNETEGEETQDSVYKASKSSNEEENEDGLDYLKKNKSKSNLEIEEAQEKKKEKTYHEEDIESNWEGKLKKENSLFDQEEGNKKKKKENEEEISIDGFLRGKKKVEEDFEEDAKQNKNKYKDEIIDEHLKGLVHADELSLEDSDNSKKKKTSFLNIEQQDNKPERIEEDISSYYKGKLNKSKEDQEEDEEEALKKKKNTILDIEDEKKKVEKNEDQEEESSRKKKDISLLNLEDGNKEKELEEEEEEGLDKERKRKKDSILNIEDDKLPSKKEEEKLLDADKKSEEGEREAIDKYLRGGKAKLEKEEVEESKRENTSLIDIDIEDTQEDENGNDSYDEDLLGKKNKKNETILDISHEDNGNDSEENEDDVEELDYLKKKRKETVILNIEESTKNREKQSEEEDSSTIKSKNEKVIDIDNERRERAKQELEEESKKKTHEGEVDDLTKEKMKANNKVDKIKTHYSSESSINHVDEDNWNYGKTNKDQKEDDKKKKDELELSYGEKVDLGEQTIDYRKLRDEFGGISIDREGNNVKKTGPKYYGGGAADKSKTPTYYRDDEGRAKNAVEEGQENEKASSKETIYEPNSKGLENIIRVLDYYSMPENAEEKAYAFVSNVIQKEFSGEVALFYYDEKKGRVNEATNSLSLLNDIELEEKQPQWDKLLSKGYRGWKDIKLPTWSDETFQESNIQFIYPYFEGTSLMGFAVTWFTKEFDKEKCKQLEVTLETLRGFLISNFRKGMHSGEYQGAKKEEVKSSPLKSFFGKLFGRKAS